MNYQLRLDPAQIDELEKEYVRRNTSQALEDEILETVGPDAAARGFLERNGFLKMCRWKTQRTQISCGKNAESFVQETTKVALSTGEERLRIEVLRVLDGVDWPTASVILHFAHREPYPIIDFRAALVAWC